MAVRKGCLCFDLKTGTIVLGVVDLVRKTIVLIYLFSFWLYLCNGIQCLYCTIFWMGVTIWMKEPNWNVLCTANNWPKSKNQQQNKKQSPYKFAKCQGPMSSLKETLLQMFFLPAGKWRCNLIEDCCIFSSHDGNQICVIAFLSFTCHWK